MHRVFISYRHEDDGFRVAVRDLALRLRRRGLSVVLDQLEDEERFSRGGPPEGWPAWSRARVLEAGIRILVVASPGWCSRWTAVADPGDGGGYGCAAEIGVLQQRLYEAAQVNPWMRLVVLGGRDGGVIPEDLKRYHRFADPADFDAVVAWVRGEGEPAGVGTAWPDTSPCLRWSIADQAPVAVQVGALLTAGSPHRLLLVRGHSATGKSTIAREIVAGCQSFPWLARGLFDFKGATSHESRVDALVRGLGLPDLGLQGATSHRLSRVLTALHARGRPALLVFDTYEQAGDLQEWVREHLLFSLGQYPWLRVVIVGQQVPERGNAPWRDLAPQTLRLDVPRPEDWLAWARGNGHDRVDLAFVATAWACCEGRPDILAGLLGQRD